MQCAWDYDSSRNEERLYNALVERKIASGNCYMKEIMHIVNEYFGPRSRSLPEATLTNLAHNLTGMETFCWHQDKAFDTPLGDTIANWKSTLMNVSYRDSEADMSDAAIAGVFENAPQLQSFGCNHDLVSALLRGNEYDAKMQQSFQEDAGKLAVSHSRFNSWRVF